MTLPRIDAPAVEIDADPERVWRTLLDSASPSRPRAGLFARLLGCSDRTRAGDLDTVGSTVVGFRVARATPREELALVGEHRFSSYVLTFSIQDLGGGRSLLRGTTDAAFPGVRGRAYRALVIGSGIHARLMDRMLGRLKKRAESGVSR